MPGPGFIRLCTEVFDELPCIFMKALRHRLITTQPEESSAMLSGLPLSDFHELVSNVFCELQQRLSRYSETVKRNSQEGELY